MASESIFDYTINYDSIGMTKLKMIIILRQIYLKHLIKSFRIIEYFSLTIV